MRLTLRVFGELFIMLFRWRRFCVTVQM